MKIVFLYSQLFSPLSELVVLAVLLFVCCLTFAVALTMRCGCCLTVIVSLCVWFSCWLWDNGKLTANDCAWHFNEEWEKRALMSGWSFLSCHLLLDGRLTYPVAPLGYIYIWDLNAFSFCIPVYGESTERHFGGFLGEMRRWERDHHLLKLRVHCGRVCIYIFSFFLWLFNYILIL